jgi:hypothetical protein
MAVSGIAREQNEISIGKDVGGLRRENLREADVALDVNSHVGHHGIDESVCDDAHRAFDGFFWPDELRGAAALERKLLEKTDVDIGTKSEGEDATMFASTSAIVGDGCESVLTSLADGGLTIGDEENERKSIASGSRTHRFTERALDVC